MLSTIRVLKPTKPNKRSDFRIATLDIETANWTEIKLVGFYDGINYYHFRHYDEFLDFLFNENLRYRGFIIYAHNGGKFDFLPLLESLRKRKEKHRIVEINGCIAQVSLKKRRIYFRDSFKLLPSSLKKLAISFDVETKKQEIDFSRIEFNPENQDHIEYNKADCIALFQVLKKFRSQDYIREVKTPLTTASLAMRVFRTKFLKRSYKITSDDIQNFCRKSYLGGRVEIFRLHGKDISLYDVNSLYPYCMKKPMPVEYLCKSTNWKDFGFHDVTVKTPKNMHIPILPLKLDRLIFPLGTFRGVYFSEELKLAVSRGYEIIEHHEGAEFLKDDEIFQDYVDTFFKLKKDAKGTALEQIAKLLLNSLYGKFGEREEKTSIDYFDDKNDGFEYYRSFEFFLKTGLVKISKNSRSVHSLVNIASAVTAYGRIHLYETMLEPHADSIYYCDTDSGFIPKKSYQKTGEGLGEWKHEKDIDEAYFRLPKGYALKSGEKWGYKLKGFSKDFLNTIKIDDFLNSDLFHEKIRPMTLKSSLIQNDAYFSTKLLKKSIKNCYKKRKILKNGETSPLHVYFNEIIE